MVMTIKQISAGRQTDKDGVLLGSVTCRCSLKRREAPNTRAALVVYGTAW